MPDEHHIMRGDPPLRATVRDPHINALMQEFVHAPGIRHVAVDALTVELDPRGEAVGAADEEGLAQSVGKGHELVSLRV